MTSSSHPGEGLAIDGAAKEVDSAPMAPLQATTSRRENADFVPSCQMLLV